MHHSIYAIILGVIGLFIGFYVLFTEQPETLDKFNQMKQSYQQTIEQNLNNLKLPDLD